MMYFIYTCRRKQASPAGETRSNGQKRSDSRQHFRGIIHVSFKQHGNESPKWKYLPMVTMHFCSDNNVYTVTRSRHQVHDNNWTLWLYILCLYKIYTKKSLLYSRLDRFVKYTENIIHTTLHSLHNLKKCFEHVVVLPRRSRLPFSQYHCAAMPKPGRDCLNRNRFTFSFHSASRAREARTAAKERPKKKTDKKPWEKDKNGLSRDTAD